MSRLKLIRITTVPISLYGLLNGQLHFMSSYFEVIGISSAGQELDKVTQGGVRTYAVEMTRQISPIKDLVALYKLSKLLVKEKPDIVHTHTPKAGILGMLAAIITRVPVRLHTVAGLPLMEASGIKRKILEWVEKITYACATKVYPNSNGLNQFIVENNYCKPDKLKVLGNGSSNGIDTSFFSRSVVQKEEIDLIRNKYQIPESCTVFCFVGRIVGDKGINELVEAFVKIYDKFANTRLLLVGYFERKLDKLKDETEKHIDSHPGIIWTDYQKDVRPFLAVSDIFTFPSYREGFPNVVMQACAMDLPCIVSDINGCNEIIDGNSNGMIIPPKNSEALYNAMEELMLNKEKQDVLLVKARKSIVERYERSYVWGKLLEEYKSYKTSSD